MITSLIVSTVLFFTPAKEDRQINNGPETILQMDSISWMSIEEINKIVEKNIKKNKVKTDKLILVDFYTDWCGWCHKLDQTTYKDSAVIDLMNKYFYAVKFDAELRDTIQFANVIYGYKGSGTRVTNDFALTMASRPGGRIGYPTMTIITPLGEKITAEGGYKDPAKMVLMLKYYGEGYYKTMDFQTFLTQKPKEITAPAFSD